MSYTQYQRDGHMRNGRAPGNSLGKSAMQRFDNAGVKVGATYKLDGRNYFTGHVGYGTRAPMPNDAYVSPRTKDTQMGDLKSERYFSADLGYTWNYRNFRGSLTGFYTTCGTA